MRSCTGAQKQQEANALVIGIALFIVLLFITYKLLVFVNASKIRNPQKFILRVLLIILGIPISIGMSLIVAFFLSPWCL